jgi:hypothetical protein
MALGVAERLLTIQPKVLLWIDYQPHRAASLPLVNASRFPKDIDRSHSEGLPIGHGSQVALDQLQHEDKPLIISACRWGMGADPQTQRWRNSPVAAGRAGAEVGAPSLDVGLG